MEERKSRGREKNKEGGQKMLRKLGLLFLGVLLVLSFASAAYSELMVDLTFKPDTQISAGAAAIAGEYGVNIQVDEAVDGMFTVVDWSENPVSLETALDMMCSASYIWGKVQYIFPEEKEVYMIAPIDEKNDTFQELCGDPVAITLLYADDVKEALSSLDNYHQRFCKADPERNRIFVHAPERIRQKIYRYFTEVFDTPRETVTVSACVTILREGWLAALGFTEAEYEWGTAVEKIDRQLVRVITGFGGLYITENASKFLARINMIARKGYAEIKASPSVVGEIGYPLQIEFVKKTWRPTTSYPYQREGDKDNIIYTEVVEVETPIRLSAIPLVKDDVITLKKLEITVAHAEGQVEQGNLLFPIISENTVRSRVTLKNGQTLIVGGLSQRAKKNITHLLLPGKRWETENVEVLIFVTPRLWEERFADKDTFLDEVLKLNPESLTKKKKGNSLLGLVLFGLLVWGATSVK